MVANQRYQSYFAFNGILFPLPYYLEMPGGAYDIRSVVTVNHKEDKEKDLIIL